jgi:addiction module HigA family antidote
MTEIARSLGVSRQLLYSIVNEKAPITPEVAVRLGKLVGNGPEVWVNMQAAYDLWHAEREVDVSQVPTLTAAEAAE